MKRLLPIFAVAIFSLSAYSDTNPYSDTPDNVKSVVGQYMLVNAVETKRCPNQLVVQYASSYKQVIVHELGQGDVDYGLSREDYFLGDAGKKQSTREGGFLGRKRIYKYKENNDSFSYNVSRKRIGYFRPKSTAVLRKYSELKKLSENVIVMTKTVEKGSDEDKIEYSYEYCNYERVDGNIKDFISYFGNSQL